MWPACGARGSEPQQVPGRHSFRNKNLPPAVWSAHQVLSSFLHPGNSGTFCRFLKTLPPSPFLVSLKHCTWHLRSQTALRGARHSWGCKEGLTPHLSQPGLSWQENVSLADILSLRDSGLSEQEAWAVCLECSLSLRSIAHAAIFLTLCITPDTLAFNTSGNVCFMEQLSGEARRVGQTGSWTGPRDPAVGQSVGLWEVLMGSPVGG